MKRINSPMVKKPTIQIGKLGEGQAGGGDVRKMTLAFMPVMRTNKRRFILAQKTLTVTLQRLLTTPRRGVRRAFS